MFKILQYFEMERNYAKKTTEGLLRKYSVLWEHMHESQVTVSKLLYTLARGPLHCEAIVVSLPIL